MQFDIDIHIDIQQYLLVLLETRYFALLEEELPQKAILHLETLLCKDGNGPLLRLHLFLAGAWMCAV